jgi:hypothetical protein
MGTEVGGKLSQYSKLWSSLCQLDTVMIFA